jgi:hypothetical protein
MKPEHWFTLCNLVLTAIGLYFGPTIAVRRSLEQFRSQKWWERKANAYDELIRAASRLCAYHSRCVDVEMKGWQMTEEWKRATDEKRKEAVGILENYSDFGGFAISETAGYAIRRIQASFEPKDGEPPSEYHDRVAAVLNEELGVLKKCGVLDLSLTPSTSKPS